MPSRLPLLVSAYAMSSFGSYLDMVALGLYALHLTESPLQTGLFMALRVGSGFVAGPVAGRLATRPRRKHLMICADLLAAASLLTLAASPSMELLYGLAVILGAVQSLWGVALRSSVPEIVGQGRRARANSLLVTGRSGAMLLGFAASGVLVTWLGYQTVLVIDALTYLACAAMLAGVPFPRLGATSAEGHEPRRAETGLAALTPVLGAMIALRVADAFGSASHNVALPLYANLIFPGAPAAFAATFTTAWALGSLVTGRWLAGMRDVGGERGFGVATALMSVFFVVAFTGLPIWLLIPVVFAAGAADTYAEVGYTTRLQTIDDAQRAGVFGLAASAQNAGFGLGMVGCAALLEVFEPLPVVAAAHAVALVAALGYLVFAVRKGRARTVEAVR
ncbi:MFS transporter [Catellatospora chokoriensis]|uniref:MFS transporter n=1 Tax=Catellatospora chokoriensis TaxID=310353 RepID=A0A8J3NPN3_9ACTN|nr:MFS transporter [Catellatospora chokoriensis]GIF87641.1 MFS transporter [Catellatospora chokoriensis]